MAFKQLQKAQGSAGVPSSVFQSEAAASELGGRNWSTRRRQHCFQWYLWHLGGYPVVGAGARGPGVFIFPNAEPVGATN